MHSPNTQDTQTQPGSKNIPGLTWLALVLGLACVAAVLLAALGYRAEALSLGAAVQSIRWAATAGGWRCTGTECIGGSTAAVPVHAGTKPAVDP